MNKCQETHVEAQVMKLEGLCPGKRTDKKQVIIY